MFKTEYEKILDWLEDFISSGQANEKLGNNWEEEDLVKYLKDNFKQIWDKAMFYSSYSLFDKSWHWKEFYTLFFKKEKYIIQDNVLIKPCLRDIKKADDIPDTVKEIGKYAFNNCEYLRSITIPNSVTSIGEYAFYNCSGLTTIRIPNSVESIGYNAFTACSSLTNITIPNSLTCITRSAFEGCFKLTSITIPNSVQSIDKCAFLNCSGLTNITIPNSVTNIGNDAFYNCTSLTTINFKGTKEESHKIYKNLEWCNDENKLTIHCSDGDLEI